MTPETIAAYAAGFFDGEGYVGLLKRKRGTSIEYFVQVSIGQNDGNIMDWVKENFGGNLYVVKRDGSFYWTISNRAAYKFLKRVLPYLKYKKPQAELALQFFDGRPNTKHLLPEEYERREQIYLALKAQKKIFSPSLL